MAHFHVAVAPTLGFAQHYELPQNMFWYRVTPIFIKTDMGWAVFEYLR